MARSTTVWLQVGLFALASVGVAMAQEQGFEPDYRDLAIGVHANDLSTDQIDVFACGSNGGPPLAMLTGWTDYMQCAPDEKGLHEVYIEFDTELQRLVESTEEQYGESPWFKKFSGTRVANFAVVMSMLFDDEGIGRVFRVVTDQRAGIDERGQAYMLQLRVLPQYGRDGWACVDREPGPRESPVGEVYINQRCEKLNGGKLVTTESHLFRKAGQTGVDLQGHPVAGDYESLTTWETSDASFLEKLE
jgi:hypothetical protein